MIQRKQTIFLFLAFVAIVVCLFCPIMVLTPNAVAADDVVYNLFVVNGADHSYSFKVFPMFIILALAGVIAFVNIFLFRNRKLQMQLCVVGNLLIIAWYVLYAVYALVVLPEDKTMGISYFSCLPLVAAILTIMARNGIKSDERLVKAADRIR